MKRGYTLTELIIGMLISSILILTIVVMSTTAVSSHHYLSKEAEAYNDLYYGVDMIERSIRRAQDVSVDTTQNILTADNFIFRIDQGDLVYFDTANSNKRNVIINGTGATNLQFVPSSADPESYTAVISDTITLSGGKTANLAVNLNVTRRN